ncbi:arabinosyltransferase domain-containing protein [Actinomycetospora termitidis]|uniref:Arabinosyltransferase domain-containing protein n=1 Tax=Actinomycetospora termitidis TaxID=3053470 RepID=A0ABT7M205_9PSEU|nr:arabinosyltransferase domain-containing protein [Actinomycetospora sp. Odt1-22]MDL5154681.1 arabinosyltransferase domain-containing protein [Actinomycetospora sp. Odt1-22]
MGEDTDRGVEEPPDPPSGSGSTSTTPLRLLRRKLSTVRLVPRTERADREGLDAETERLPPDAFTPDDERPDRWGPDDWGLDGLLVARVVAVASAVVAVVCALLLPFAPVVQNSPEIRWPLNVDRPESTMLMLTAYQPESFSARFSCRTAREAGATPAGYVLTTMAPSANGFDEKALSIRVRSDTLTVRSGGQDIVAERLPPGDCSYTVRGDTAAVQVNRDGRDLGRLTPRFGEADPDEIRNTPPDSLPDPKPISALPDVDALSTSLTALPGAAPDDLAVSITADDRYASSPTSYKRGLITAAILAVVLGGIATTASIVLSRRKARRRDPELLRPTPWWARIDRILLARLSTWRPRLVDAVVVVALWAWLYLAPLTDDDGYYSAMAANVPHGGYVPNYYQLYNQGFTPFSWPYYLLSWWQQHAGFSPVALRVPSVVLGLLTWIAIRVFVARCAGLTHPWKSHRWLATASRVALCVAFLSWWLAYDVGTRPEPYTAVFAAGALALVAEGIERRRLDLLAGSVGLGSIGLMTAPTGFICLAPLLAATPTVWRLIRERSVHWWEIPPRWLVVIAPGALGAVFGFADGTYADFVRSQEIFAPIQRAQTWYLEFERYASLLNETTRFGTYAKRITVLLCLLALIWFLMTAVVARVRDLPVPGRLMLAGWSTILAFALLLPTPSKPSHHFGAIVGVGAPFLALLLVAGPGLVRDSVRAGKGRVPVPAILAAAVAAIAVIALAGHGRNRWAFMWGLGQPSWLDYPSVKGFYFDQPQYWAVLLVVLTLAVVLVTSIRGRGWRPWAMLVAIPMLCVAAMGISTTRAVADFALAADRTSTTYSPAGDAWRDPAAVNCGAEQAIDVLTPQRYPLAPLIPVPAADEEPPDQPFPRDAFLPTSPPPRDLAPNLPVWGSFQPPSEGRSPDARTGSFTTGWYRLPPGPPSAIAVTTEVSGRVGKGNSLAVEFGRPGPGPGGVEPLGVRPVKDTSDDTAWRAVDLTKSQSAPADARFVRVTATDQATDVGGWLALSAPLFSRWAPMNVALPRDGVYTVNWENAFLFPCITQPVQQNGVTQTMDGFLGYGETRGEALADFVAKPDSGGIVGNAYREAEVTELRTRFRDFPDIDDDVLLMLFEQPYPSERYTVERNSRVVSGLTP